MKIQVKNNDINKALRILKKKLFLEGTTKEMREREHFVSKGEQRRLAEKAGAKRWQKKRAKFEQGVERREQQLIQQNKRKSKAAQRQK